MNETQLFQSVVFKQGVFLFFFTGLVLCRMEDLLRSKYDLCASGCLYRALARAIKITGQISSDL